MKFLIIAKRLNNTPQPRLNANIAEECRQRLNDLRGAILDEAYVCDNGGIAFSINADSVEEVAFECRQHDISLYANIDIYPVSVFGANGERPKTAKEGMEL